MNTLRNSLPKMKTTLPGPVAESLLQKRIEEVPQGISYGIPTFIAKGEGAMVEDVDGNILLDFAGGIGVLNIGYSHPEVIEATKNQLDLFYHSSVNVLQYSKYVELAGKLNQLIPGNFPKKTMFVNSGAEANENAIKIARKYTGRKSIVSFTGAFHGRTNLTMGLTSKVKPYKLGFGPFAGDLYRAEFPYYYRRPETVTLEEAPTYFISKLHQFFKEHVDPDEVAAVIIEPVQGEGGFIPAPIAFIKALRSLCDLHGMLLICDEIQTGFCRTGRMFASDYWADQKIYADITTSAKSIAAGLPLSAVTARTEIIDAAQPGGIGGTYSGNPVALAAALKVVEVLERDHYAQKSIKIGKTIIDRLQLLKTNCPIIGDIRGLGSMIGLELVTDLDTKEPASALTKKIIQTCNASGLIILDAGIRSNVIRFLVPLCVTDQQLAAGLDILENSLLSHGVK